MTMAIPPLARQIINRLSPVVPYVVKAEISHTLYLRNNENPYGTQYKRYPGFCKDGMSDLPELTSDCWRQLTKTAMLLHRFYTRQSLCSIRGPRMHSSQYSRHFLNLVLTMSGTLPAWWPQRWPTATLWGIDSSSSMLCGTCVVNNPQIEWVCTDVAQWCPDEQLDLLFTNSLLHFLDHQHLLPVLLSYVRSGGQLALQLPDCFDEPWYQLMLEILRDGGVNSTPLRPLDLYHRVTERH
jgi:hypothetical protein